MKQSAKTSSIGINVRSGAVYGVQFKQRGGIFQISTAASETLELPAAGQDALVLALRRLIEQNAFKGRRVVSALPAADVDIRPLRLPPGITPGSAGFEQAMLTEARSCLMYDPMEAVIDYLPFPKDASDADQRHMVLLIASRRERVNRFLAIFQEAQLHCEHLEVAPCAAARMLRKHQGFYAIVDIDEQQTVIAVAESHRMLFSRTVKTGYGDWLKRVSQALEVTPQAAQDLLRDVGLARSGAARVDLNTAEETGVVQPEVIPSVLHEVCARSLEQLIKEIRRTIDYFALLPGGGRVGTVFLLGEVLPRALDHLLQERLQASVLIGGAGEAAGSHAAAAAARWTVAQGLALRWN